MRIRNILVAYNGSTSSDTALIYACNLARSNDAHVTALVSHAAKEDYAASRHLIPKAAQEIIDSANAEMIDAARSAFNKIAATLNMGKRLSFLLSQGQVDETLARAARCYDLLILGDLRGDDVDAHLALHPDQIALRAGKPVVIVPRQYDNHSQHGKAVVAWDGKRSCARALSDSFALLENENEGAVTVLTVSNETLACSVSDVLIHLERHDIQPQHVHTKAEPNTAAAILHYCDQSDASLLIMGAYEHSKFRVDLLGGITSKILRKANIPVLLSH